MSVKPKVGQIWKHKKTGDRVEVKKILYSQVKVFDMDGSNYGKQFLVDNADFITQYRLIKDV